MFFRKKSFLETTVREVVFGLEDSLVSTVGAITGIAVGTDNQMVVILSGLVILAVEATSMGAGSYLSSKTTELIEIGGGNKKNIPWLSIKSGLVMLVFYVFGGLVPLVPYFLFFPKQAMPISIFLSVTALAGVGFWTGKITKRSGWWTALEMVVISLGAVGIGYGIGWLVSQFFPVDTSA